MARNCRHPGPCQSLVQPNGVMLRMAYSMLAGLPPVYGLYVSFIAPLFYAVFGRCAQLSMGTFAVVSLLLSEPIRRLCAQISEQARKNHTAEYGGLIPVCFAPDDIRQLEGDPNLFGISPDQLFDLRPPIAFTLTFLIGILQVSKKTDITI
ncbi:unnamed protein product [Echinostoma caproni]|uniref:Sulfate_transp domain-containing protein n=1 Tax=Echinostoma caproni TaxID=27848 RepID=A0A183ACN7_9TREM|nr:unnamed protein product [Echinostoma caproni]